MKTPSLYRGLALPIKNAKTIPEILEVTKLNWETNEVPSEYQFGGETLKVPHEKVLYRSDTGAHLATVSDRFKVHQNAQIVEGLSRLAEAGNIKVTHGGGFEGGAVVFLHGSVNRKFDLLETPNPETVGKYYKPVKDTRKVGDIVRLDFSLRGGHRPGTPTVGQAVAMRLACFNGAVVTDSKCMFRLTHLQEWKKSDQQAMVKFVEDMVKQFETFEQKARRLSAATLSDTAAQLYMIELVQPELIHLMIEKTEQMVVAATAPATGTLHTKLSGKQILETLLEQEESKHIVSDLLAGVLSKQDERLSVDRSTKALLGVIKDQPGYELAQGTAWGAYNGATYYVDHARGRNADHCVESSLQGSGARIKAHALELAIEYTERVN